MILLDNFCLLCIKDKAERERERERELDLSLTVLLFYSPISNNFLQIKKRIIFLKKPNPLSPCNQRVAPLLPGKYVMNMIWFTMP